MLRATRTALGVEYAIRDVLEPARQLEKQGVKILKLNIGDPCAYDFDTPQHVKDALIEAVRTGGPKNGYAPSEGIPELRQAIAAREKRRNNVDYNAEEDVVVTTGVSESLQMLYASVLGPGDEVLVPGPSYPPYTALAKMWGAKPVPYRLVEGQGWQPDVDDLRRKINERTRMIVVNNPNNPTGGVAGRRALETIAGIAGEYQRQLLLASDEIYDDLVFDAKHLALASLAKDVAMVTFNGLSKVYLSPGWRLGWTLFRDHGGRLAEIKKAFLNLARLRLSASSIAQYGAVAGLNGPQDYLKEASAKLRRRRDLAAKRLNEIEGISCTKPEGAFYAFPRVASLEAPGSPWRGDKEFVLDLLKEAHVLVVHGSGFDAAFGNNHFRIVILPPEPVLEEALGAIEKFMRKRLRTVAV